MRKFSIVGIVIALLLLPVIAFADIAIDVTGSIEAGTSVTGPTIYRCEAWRFQGQVVSPATQCALTGSASLDFGVLSKDLKDVSGRVTSAAGCFYGENYFVLYLFPDAWGGVGYELRQKSAVITNDAVAKALVMTPVYAKEDQFLFPDGTFVAQGELTAQEQALNPQINQPFLATAVNDALILKSRRARIVRAEYGIPPFPGTGQVRPAGWQAIPLSTPAQSGITGQIVISLTQF